MKNIYLVIFAYLLMVNISLAQKNTEVAQSVTNITKENIQNLSIQQPVEELKVPLANPWYARASVGGGIGLCYYDPCEHYDQVYTNNSNTITSVQFSPGTGINASVAAGYNFSKYIGTELIINDFWGFPKGTKWETSGEGGTINTTRQFRSMMLSVIPSVVISPGWEKFNPYARFGLDLGVYTTMKYKETVESGNNTTVTYGTYKGGFPIGYSVAGGVDYKINKTIGLNLEFLCNGINFTPKHYEITKYTVNGENLVGTLTNYQRYTDFVKSYDRAETILPSEHNKALKETYSFSNFEVDFGVAINF